MTFIVLTITLEFILVSPRITSLRQS